MSEDSALDPPKKSQFYVNVPHPAPHKEEYAPIDTWNVTKAAFTTSALVGLLAVSTATATSRRTDNWLFRGGKALSAIVIGATTYKFSSSALSNLRKKRDTTNEFYAGAITGAVLGSFTRSLVSAVGISAGFGVISALTFWSGNLLGDSSKSSVAFRGINEENNFKPKPSSVVERQEFWEVARRRPLSQTLEELGEGAFKP